MSAIKTATLAAAIVMTGFVLTAGAAQAGCVDKAAEATAGDEKSAKWFALETMVQSVSWGLWPAFVASGSVPGYKITRQSYRCQPNGAAVKCLGQATFCKS